MTYYINQALEEHFPEGCGVRVIAEPGCYMVCSAYKLCIKVLGRKIDETEAQDDGECPSALHYYDLSRTSLAVCKLEHH